MKKNNEKYFVEFCLTIFSPNFIPSYSSIDDIPKYKVDFPPYGHAEATLIQEHRRINLWKKGYINNRHRLNEITIQVLSGLHQYEAAVWKAVISGSKIPCDGFDELLVREAYPGLLKHEYVEKQYSKEITTEVKVEDDTDMFLPKNQKKFVVINKENDEVCATEENEITAVQKAIAQGIKKFMVLCDGQAFSEETNYTPKGRLSKETKKSRGLI